MSTTICTLYEKHYETGVGALLNSLIINNFHGIIAVGYRGNPPTWLPQIRQQNGRFFLSETAELVLQPLETDFHLTYYKPFFMSDWLEKYSETDKIFYFDPDIVNKCAWSFYEKWVENGITLCLDNCYSVMPFNHPFRHEWLALGKRCGWEPKQEQNLYYNAGFLGLKRENQDFLKIWKALIIKMIEEGYNVKTMKNISRYNAVVTDQDLLNAATMFAEIPISAVGTDGMDFTNGGFLMSHALGTAKPWKQKFFFNLLKTGNIPSAAEKEFFKNIDAPIRLFSAFQKILRKTDLRLASVLGRILGH